MKSLTVLFLIIMLSCLYSTTCSKKLLKKKQSLDNSLDIFNKNENKTNIINPNETLSINNTSSNNIGKTSSSVSSVSSTPVNATNTENSTISVLTSAKGTTSTPSAAATAPVSAPVPSPAPAPAPSPSAAATVPVSAAAPVPAPSPAPSAAVVALTDSAIEEICSAKETVTAALAELDLEVDKLISQFKSHIKLYQKWKLDAVKQEDKDELLNKEKIYLNNFLVDAMSIMNILPQLKIEIENFKLTNCPCDDDDTTVSETDVSATTAESDSDILIQLVVDRYNELGLKMDTKMESLVQTHMKNRNEKKNFLKKN